MKVKIIFYPKELIKITFLITFKIISGIVVNYIDMLFINVVLGIIIVFGGIIIVVWGIIIVVGEENL